LTDKRLSVNHIQALFSTEQRFWKSVDDHYQTINSKACSMKCEYTSAYSVPPKSPNSTTPPPSLLSIMILRRVMGIPPITNLATTFMAHGMAVAIGMSKARSENQAILMG